MIVNNQNISLNRASFTENIFNMSLNDDTSSHLHPSFGYHESQKFLFEVKGCCLENQLKIEPLILFEKDNRGSFTIIETPKTDDKEKSDLHNSNTSTSSNYTNDDDDDNKRIIHDKEDQLKKDFMSKKRARKMKNSNHMKSKRKVGKP